MSTLPQPAGDALPAATSIPTAPPTSQWTELAIGTAAEGFSDVDAALTRARDRWRSSGIDVYGFSLTTACACDEAGQTWVRVFDPEWEVEGLRTVEVLFDEIEHAVEAEPLRIEVTFAAGNGYPVSYRSVSDTETSIEVESFHRIGSGPTEFDGDWWLLEGTVDDTAFGSPAATGLRLTLDDGMATYNTDCNEVFGYVDLYRGSFGIGPMASTAVGCNETPQVALYEEALARVGTIALDGADLVLTGDAAELRFVPAQTPRMVGDLPFVAAGETLTFDVPDGGARPGHYLITYSVVDTHADVRFLLTASHTPDTEPTWQDWTGIPDGPAPAPTSPGPVTIVVPHTIVDADWNLCSPYWEPDHYCFVLPVRPPSAPWLLTTGPHGIVLHDADTTSQTIIEEPARIAFYVDGRLVYQRDGGQIELEMVDSDGAVATVPVEADDVLLDAGTVDGATIVVVAGSEGTATIDADSGIRTRVGPPAVEADLTADLVLIRRDPTSLQAVALNGAVVWDRTIDADTMVLVEGEHVRLAAFDNLIHDAGPVPFYQFIDHEIIDAETGAELDSSRREIAIPDEGDQIEHPCIRPELRDEMLLCTQPDGRVIVFDAEGGVGTVMADAAAMASYAR